LIARILDELPPEIPRRREQQRDEGEPELQVLERRRACVAATRARNAGEP
jgi:hypothetical protein